MRENCRRLLRATSAACSQAGTFILHWFLCHISFLFYWIRNYKRIICIYCMSMSISLLLCVCLFFGYCLLSLHIFILPHLLLSTFYFFSGAIFTTRCTWDMKEDCVAKWIDEAGGEMPRNIPQSVLPYSTLLYSILLYPMLFYSILLYSLFYFILFYILINPLLFAF